MTRWRGFRASTLSPVEELVGLGHGRMPGAMRDCHAGPAESSIAIAMAMSVATAAAVRLSVPAGPQRGVPKRPRKGRRAP